MQLPLDLHKHNNGNGSHSRRERDLAADLTRWIADLDAAETLRREQLRQIRGLRKEVYRHAMARGVPPKVLRVTRLLMRGAAHD